MRLKDLLNEALMDKGSACVMGCGPISYPSLNRGRATNMER